MEAVFGSSLITWNVKLIWPRNSIPRYIPQRSENKHIYLNVPSSVSHNSKKVEATQMFTKRRIYKMWYFRMMECYLAIKGNEVLTYATTWMNLENIMLNERKHTEKATHCIIPFIWKVQRRWIHRDRKRIYVRGQEKWILTAQWVWGFHLGWWKKFWKYMVVRVVLHCECIWCH